MVVPVSVRSWLLVAMALAFAAPALGQGETHAHEAAASGPVFILHDGPDDGYQFVGNLAHFGYLVVGDDGKPLPHKDGRLTITLLGASEAADDDVVLFDSADMHDYDGITSADIVFPTAGPYEVKAVVDGVGEGTFRGVVEEPQDLVAATLAVEAPSAAREFVMMPFRIALRDGAGALLPHTDALVEVRNLAADLPFFRVHLHSHEEPMEFLFAFPDSGEYEVRVVGYVAFPEKGAGAFLPQVAAHRVTVTEGMGGVPPPQRPAPVNCVPLENSPTERCRAPLAPEPGAFAVHGTFDPAARQQLFSGMRNAVTLANATTRAPVAHVDFEAELKDPYQRILFASRSLHEYDGVFELFGRYGEYGRYTLTTMVQKGDYEATLEMPFDVAAPAPFFAAGATFTSLAVPADLKAGVPAEVTFRNANAGNVPAQHTEVEFALLREAGGLPLLVSKLHTHDTGDMRATVTFPAAGTWFLQVDPLTIHGDPAPLAFGPTAGASRLFRVEVAEGLPLPTVDVGEPELAASESSQGLPGPGAAVAFVAALAGLVLASRRRVA